MADRGYTGHEHLDNVRMIHMNGRVYDPVLGRMLSPDPMPGDPSLPMSLATFAYAHNNPATNRDPSGFYSTHNDSPASDDSGIPEIIVTAPKEWDPMDFGDLDDFAKNVVNDAFTSLGGDIYTKGEPAREGPQRDTSNPNIWNKPLSRNEKDELKDYLKAVGRVGAMGKVVLVNPGGRVGPALGLLRQMAVPRGVSIDANMRYAQWLRGSDLPSASLVWASRLVTDWDYKSTRGSQFQAVGNFNYGATGRSMGFGEETLFRYGGLFQVCCGQSDPSFGSPLGGWPYGDDPVDQIYVQLGYLYGQIRGF